MSFCKRKMVPFLMLVFLYFYRWFQIKSPQVLNTPSNTVLHTDRHRSQQVLCCISYNDNFNKQCFLWPHGSGVSAGCDFGTRGSDLQTFWCYMKVVSTAFLISWMKLTHAISLLLFFWLSLLEVGYTGAVPRKYIPCTYILALCFSPPLRSFVFTSLTFDDQFCQRLSHKGHSGKYIVLGVKFQRSATGYMQVMESICEAIQIL